jgi:hypothetical protein
LFEKQRIKSAGTCLEPPQKLPMFAFIHKIGIDDAVFENGISNDGQLTPRQVMFGLKTKIAQRHKFL